MSYSLVPYVIDLAQLRAAIGSRNQSLIAAIVEKHPRQFESPDSELPLEQALTQLVMGEELGETATHQYGYALELLADQLGQKLPFDLWSGIRWDAMEDSGVASIMDSGPPVSLPAISDFPNIGYIEQDKIAQMVAAMDDEGLTNDVPDLEELLKEFEGWLRMAAQAKKDLLFFYY